MWPPVVVAVAVTLATMPSPFPCPPPNIMLASLPRACVLPITLTVSTLIELTLTVSSFKKPEGIGGSKKESGIPFEEENPLGGPLASGVGRLLLECLSKSAGVGVEGECSDVLHWPGLLGVAIFNGGGTSAASSTL